MKRRRALAVISLALLAGLAAAERATRPEPLPAFDTVRTGWQPSEAHLTDRHGRPLHTRRVNDRVRRLDWASLAEISPVLPEAVIAMEDRRFRAHAGVDWRALAALPWRWWRNRALSGASTISMQTASLLQRKGSATGRRGLLDKLVQLRAALALERAWRKGEILEAYLNLAHYRGELQGVAAAGGALFGKRPDGLDRNEAALLAALLSSPNARPESAARRACAWHGGDCEVLARQAREGLTQRQAAPQALLVPHLAARLLDARHHEVATTLDARVQEHVLETLRQQLRGLRGRNARDAAALVVENVSGEVIAYVGSAGEDSGAPQVDGVRARRPAGSTLKPFLYGLALERRLITAASPLADAPIHLETASGLYIPQNYERDFKGKVSARTALASSLNIPAVRVLSLLDVEPFRERLFALGYAGITRDGEYYGLALALGAAEVSLWEQVNAYRTLANGGWFSPLRLRQDDHAAERSVMSPQAAYVIGDMLADRAARAPTFGLENVLATPFWSAVKTGTSKDMRDNWCVGYSARYTVGVWLGNFEGDAMHEVSGVSGAAPAWRRILSALHEHEPSPPPVPPPGLQHAWVRFDPLIEPARGEWFLSGTETALIASSPDAIRARIATPPDGMLVALDPDIPPVHQKLLIRIEGARAGTRLVLDGVDLAAAESWWTPERGAHELRLLAADGTELDRARFRVGTGPVSKAP